MFDDLRLVRLRGSASSLPQHPLDETQGYMTRFSRLASPLFVLLSHTLILATQARHSFDQSIRTPAHLLAHRNLNFPRSLLEGQLTVGSLLNASVTVGRTSSISSGAPTESGNCTGSPAQSTSCFPFRSAGFVNQTVPQGMRREDWWCKEEDTYGFLGFSYPLEISDCSDPSNGYGKIKDDLKRMKDEFGANFVRPYGVECRETSVWLNLVKACVEVGMALIVQVWWGFQQDQNLWRQSQASVYEIFENSTYSQIAPFVVHSASFGSEPIGDWVDGDNFVADLALFRKKMNSFGVPVGISEDWDRPQRMKQDSSVFGIGKSVLNNTDIAHLHVMPYYHPEEVPTINQAWEYTKQQVIWARERLGQPTMITETMWSSERGGSHGRGSHDEESTLKNYRKYWQAFSSNCQFFKEQKVGYFVHTFDDSMEPYFGMIDSDGKNKIDGWKPNRC